MELPSRVASGCRAACRGGENARSGGAGPRGPSLTRINPHRIRYRYDDARLYGIRESTDEVPWTLLPYALSQNIRVSETVLPRVHRAVSIAAQRLDPTLKVTAFAYASPEVNARCVVERSRQVLVFVSSELITLLSDDELSFVVGHEFGHVIFEHYRRMLDLERTREPRELELARAGEISADRAGFISCMDARATVGAMLKTASGLPDKQLDIDVAAYLRQAFDLKQMDVDTSLAWSGHPPMLIRARSVLRFESVVKAALAGDDATAAVTRLDEAVFQELNAVTIGGPTSEFFQAARDAAFWDLATQTCADGALGTTERKRLEALFGTEKVASLVGLLANESKASALEFIEHRAVDTRHRLEAAPLGALTIFSSIVAAWKDSKPPRDSRQAVS